ncbi:hypothetical protein EW026_g835 [Hermanssonia centrifuga]|uniref:Uncharacterized protein n=1 Tax=Hermanssonia centrifuga TaxID=98765 RepID=A0A4S4KTH9_9APHY|nr:hypothetical protein EW026_g835 [Hermanssonia centrifuga]
MRSESSLSSTSSEVDNESTSSQSSIKTSSSVRSLEGTAEAFQHVRLQSSQDLNRKLSRGVKIGNQTKAHVVTKLSLPSVGWSSESDSDLPQYIDPAVLWPEQVGKWRLTSEDGDNEKPIERLEGYSDVEQQSSEDISDVSSDDGESELEDSDVSSDASEEEQEVNDPSPTRSVVKKTLPRRAKRTRAESLEEDENSTEASSDEDRDEDYKDDDYGQSYADNKPLRRLRPLVRRAASHVSLSGDDGDDNELRRKRVRTSGRFKDPSSLDIDYSSDVDKPFQEAVKVDCSHCSSRNQHQQTTFGSSWTLFNAPYQAATGP